MLVALDAAASTPRPGIRVSASPVQPKEAIDFFGKKAPLDKKAWLDLSQDARKRAFTAAWVTDVNVLQSVKDSLDKAIADGESFESWKKRIRKELGDRWSRPDGYLETVFRNNVQSAYAAGRYKAQTTPLMLKMRPYWRLVVLMDDRTSPYCKPLASPPVILPAEDPWWTSNFPPRHHRCRTTCVSMSQRQAERAGIVKSPPKTGAQDGWGSTAGLGEWQPTGEGIDPKIFKPAENEAKETPEPKPEVKPPAQVPEVRTEQPVPAAADRAAEEAARAAEKARAEVEAAEKARLDAERKAAEEQAARRAAEDEARRAEDARARARAEAEAKARAEEEVRAKREAEQAAAEAEAKAEAERKAAAAAAAAAKAAQEAKRKVEDEAKRAAQQGAGVDVETVAAWTKATTGKRKFPVDRDITAASKRIFGGKAPSFDTLESAWSANGVNASVAGIIYDSTLDTLQVNAAISINGEFVGRMTRTFRRKNGQLIVYHDYLELNKSAQGRGYGEAVLRNSIQMYRRIGAKEIGLDAHWVGRYTWARFGFNWDDYTAEEIRPKLAKYLADEGVPKEDAEAMAAATHKSAGAVADLQYKGRKIGKDFLLSNAIANWRGKLRLDKSDDPGYVRAKERLKL